MCTTDYNLSKLNTKKFINLCFELGVAFETTFSDETPISYSTDFAFPDLVYKNPNETVIRIYNPAIVFGDLYQDKKSEITFVCWVDEEKALFHRLCFRLQPITRNSFNFRKMMFARFNEEKAFGFSLQGKGGNFITLNFLGYGEEEFIPLYLKVKNNNGLYMYYVISAKVCDEKVSIVIEEVDEKATPSHLQSIKL